MHYAKRGCVEPVPAIRSYAFHGQLDQPNIIQWALGRQTQGFSRPWHAAGYMLGGRKEVRAEPEVPRWVKRPLLDNHCSVSYVAANGRLGTMSRFPDMSESYMTDTWGLGWQSFPASFIAAGHDHGFLRWVSCDGDGTTRMHPARAKLEFEHRCLFPRLSFHPQVITICHQVDGAAIVLREVQRLHTRLGWLDDRWVVQNFSGCLIGPEGPWDGRATEWVNPGWLTLRYEAVTVGIGPLSCKLPGRTEATPAVVSVAMDGEALNLSQRLAEHDGSEFLSKFLCGGWCVVLADRRKDLAAWTVEDRLFYDGEQARPEAELVREVTLVGPRERLTLRRDPLELDARRCCVSR